MTKLARRLALGAALLLPATAFAFPGHGNPAEMEALRNEVFAEADVDDDGALNAAEFASFHELMRARIDQQRFTKLDADGSGGITLEELDAIKRHHHVHKRHGDKSRNRGS